MKLNQRLFRDFCIVVFSIILAYIFVRLNTINTFLNLTLELKILGSFFAGIFFTSVFTIAIASVALVELANSGSVFLVALCGALGALCGDLILFLFIRDTVSDDILKFINRTWRGHFLQSFHFGFLKWLLPIFGGLIIASPLPDELGITLLGISKTQMKVLVPISFVFNFIGIILLVFVTKSL